MRGEDGHEEGGRDGGIGVVGALPREQRGKDGRDRTKARRYKDADVVQRDVDPHVLG